MIKYDKIREDLFMKFSEKVTFVRAKLNISQSKLGELLHLSSFISNYS